jgi:transcriptional regulator with XRE-family HTH domain
MTLASKLRRLQAERGVSASEIAAGAGLALQTVLDLLAGRTQKPHERTVRRLALYFDLSPAYFLLPEEELPAEAPLREEVARLEARLERLEGTLQATEGGGHLSAERRRELERKYLNGGRLTVELRGPLTEADRARLLALLDAVDRLVGGEE